VSRPARWALLAAGHLCVALAVAGAILPLLPATPFALLAAACYVRASERHHRRLMESRLLGPVLRDWRDRGGMRPRAKAVALLLLWASLGYSATRARHPVARWAIPCVAVVATAAILRVRTVHGDGSSGGAPAKEAPGRG